MLGSVILQQSPAQLVQLPGATLVTASQAWRKLVFLAVGRVAGERLVSTGGYQMGAALLRKYYLRLLDSVDETIHSSGAKLAASPLTRSRSPSPHSRRPKALPGPVDGNLLGREASGDFDWFAEKPSCQPGDARTRRKVPESLARVWLLEMVLAVEALHEMGIVCVDLSMHNILLGEKDTYSMPNLSSRHSQWSSVARSPDQSTLQDDFLIAPVVWFFSQMNKVDEEPASSCDVWSIGMILFELVSGQCFAEVNSVKASSHQSLRLPEGLAPEVEDLLRKMLKYEIKERLTLSEVKLHPFCQAADR